jgi:hypothetical protein
MTQSPIEVLAPILMVCTSPRTFAPYLNKKEKKRKDIDNTEPPISNQQPFTTTTTAAVWSHTIQHHHLNE